MITTDPSLSVNILGDRVVVHYISAVDETPCEETIHLRDVVQVAIENVCDMVHWYLQHREGWAIHFNDHFIGAAETILSLHSRLGFTLAHPDDVAGSGGKGTVVWSANS